MENENILSLVELIDSGQTTFYDIIFSKNHELGAFIFEDPTKENTYIILMKNIKKNELYPQYITDCNGSFAFD